MKLIKFYILCLSDIVTLCVRVWIEIGLQAGAALSNSVTLCVRVWIEIMRSVYWLPTGEVTLCVRVWIEISFQDGSAWRI